MCNVWRDQYAAVRNALGKALYSDVLRFTDEMMGLVKSGKKTQTTRDWMGWRWDRIIMETACNAKWMLVERNPYCREILGLVVIRVACVRSLGDMGPSEWEAEGLQEMNVSVFAQKYLRAGTPCDSCEYEEPYGGIRKNGLRSIARRKVGILRFERFTTIAQFLTDRSW